MPFLKNISIRSESGPRVAKTSILHQFVDGFWDQLCIKIGKRDTENTSKNQCKQNTDLCAKAAQTMPKWYRESHIVFEKMRLGVFLLNHRFMIIKP
jgi:hypothetical protein